ncbi:MAG: tRNA (guanosine(37)-N1)-methyltransferase TrmD [Clostridia bacterium]|nr:tRNA (guanosine(37)-N1)-methyltransferase TrmD [Clostridia bacterium]
MKFTVLTLFPELLNEFIDTSIVKKAIINNKVIIEVVDLKDFGEGKRRNVDDTIYGGGVGMLITVPILDRAIESVINKAENKSFKSIKIIYMSPKGNCLSQEKVKHMSNSRHTHYILLCGHYEGIDERIFNLYDIEEISIGEYVLTGGELPAMVIIDSVTRLIDGVLKEEATIKETHTNILLEEPHYTKPFEYKGMKVPEVLTSGNHAEVEKYNHEQSILETKRKRPDLFEKYINETTKKEGNKDGYR